MRLFRLSRCFRACAGGGLAAVSLAAGAQNLVTNGSFEQTALTQSGTITPFNVPGWTSVSPWNQLYFPGTADRIGSGNTNGAWLAGPNNGHLNGLPATSPDGGNFVAIDADPIFTVSLLGPAISQQVNGLQVGHTYTLSFDYAAAQDTTASGPTTDSWQVSLGNQVQNSPVQHIASQGFSGWMQTTMQFTATSISETLTFLAQGTPIGYPPVSLLDGVSLTDAQSPTPPVVTAVPEPGSLLLIGAGLVVLGVATRRRRHRRGR